MSTNRKIKAARNDLCHTPITPPRRQTVGEGIYLSLWRELLETQDDEFECICHSTSQRAARVAASFMVYMGCNFGRCFTEQAEQYAKSNVFVSRERAFIAAWATSNERVPGVNHGGRMIEFMLDARRDAFGRGALTTVTMEDIDTVEWMVRWWASQRAKTIREIAEPMISAYSRKALSGLFSVEKVEGPL